MTARHSTLFTLESGHSGLGFYTTQRDAASVMEGRSRISEHRMSNSLHSSTSHYEDDLGRQIKELTVSLGEDHQDVTAALESLARYYEDNNRYAEARPLYLRVLASREKVLARKHPALARSLINLSRLYQKLGHYSEAQTLCERLIAIIEEIEGPDHLSIAHAFDLLADLCEKQTLYEKAESFYQRGLAIREQALGADHLDTATTLDRLGWLYERQGLYRQALSAYQRAFSVFSESPNCDLQSVATANNMASVHIKIGDYKRAEAICQSAVPVFEKRLGMSHPDTASVLENLAICYEKQGLYRKAESFLLRALKIKQQAPEVHHLEIAAILNNLAALYTAQGLYAKPEIFYLRALAIFEQYSGKGNLDIAHSLSGLAWLHAFHGFCDKAESFGRRALEIREKALEPDHPDIVDSLSSLAFICEKRHLFGEAELLYQRALATCEKRLGLGHPHTAVCLHNLACFYTEQKFYARAESLSLRSAAIRERTLGENHPATASSLNNLALVYGRQGFWARSELCFQRCLEIFKQTLGADHPDTIRILYGLASLYVHSQQYSAAISLFSDSLRSQLNWLHREAPLMATSNRRRLLGVHGEFGGLPLNLAAVDPGFSSLFLFARLNRHGLQQQIEQRQAQLARLPGEHKPLVERVQSLVTVLASSQLDPERRRALAEERDQLEAQLYRLLPELQIRTVEITDVAATLPADAALIEFQRYIPMLPGSSESGAASRYLAFILLPDERIETIDLGSAEDLENAIEEARADTIAGFADASEAWHAVSQRMLTPLLPHLEGCTQWFLSLDGELHRVPFHLLPLPEQPDQLLVETVSLQLVTSGRDLIDRNSATATSSSAGPALVVADPAFDLALNATSQGVPGDISHQLRSRDMGALSVWTPLPATAEEGKQLSALLDAQLLTGQDATTLAVQQAQRPRVLHIATHGFFLPDQVDPDAAQPWRPAGGDDLLARFRGEDPMLRSGLVFAGANHPVADPEDDDGYLTALEAVHLDLAGTELVTLSACDTGSGDIHTGEGVYGLQRALIVAGARSMLLSLWPVPDEATCAFMVRFYTLLQQGIGRYEALVAVQRDFRHHDNIVWRHPYYWGAWQLIGDGGPIKNL